MSNIKPVYIVMVNDEPLVRTSSWEEAEVIAEMLLSHDFVSSVRIAVTL